MLHVVALPDRVVCLDTRTGKVLATLLGTKEVAGLWFSGS